MKAPIKLIKENDTIKGIFSQPINFIEGENSAKYPTALFCKTWYQFPPKDFDKISDIIQTLFVEWYNSRPETIQAFIDGEVDKLFLNTWDKEKAYEYLKEKLDNYPFKKD